MTGAIVRTLSGLDPIADREAFGDKAVLLARVIALSAEGAGMNVPPGFAIAYGTLARASGDAVAIEAWRSAVSAAVAEIEASEGVRLGEGLCLAVRASSDQSAPGSLPTVLDVGASRSALDALAERLGDRAAALDARLRFLRGLERASGQGGARQAVRGVRPSASPPVAELERDIATLEVTLALDASPDAEAELRRAIEAVAAHGAAIVVQAMRFGTSRRGLSGAGTASSRHPITGEAVVFGEIAWDKQGEDVSLGRGAGVSLRRASAGRRGEESLEARSPELLAELAGTLARTERAMGHVVDLEIAIEAGRLWVLQLRQSVLTPRAEVRTLVDRAEEGAITREDALASVRLESMARVGRIELVAEDALPGGAEAILGRGLGASPGAASGRVAIDVDDAVRRAAAGERIVLVRSDASPEDAPAVRAATAVATASGGLTSHAAVMSRALGRPCAVSVSNLRVRPNEVLVEGRGATQRLVPGDLVTVDGTRGLLVRGVAPTRWVVDDAAPRVLASWARGRSAVVVLVDDGGGDPAATAVLLEADGVWRGQSAVDVEGHERPEWSAPARWEGPAQPWPAGSVVLVAAGLVAAARVAASRSER